MITLIKARVSKREPYQAVYRVSLVGQNRYRWFGSIAEAEKYVAEVMNEEARAATLGIDSEAVPPVEELDACATPTS